MEFQARLQTHLSKHVRFYFVFGATFLFGLCAHAYRFFNLDFSHDSLMVFQDDDVVQIGLGRFLQPLYRLVRGDLGAPFLLCLLSLVWLALANYIVVSLLELRSPVHTALLCGILSTNAVLTLSFATYLPWVDVYTLAYLFTTLAVWLAVRHPLGFAAAWVPMVCSLALYQSYLNVAVILLMIIFVKHILDGLETKGLLIRLAKYLGTLLGGLVVYYAVLRLVLAATGIPLLDGENGLMQLGNYELSALLGLVISTVKYPIRYMLHPETYHPQLAAAVNLAVFAISLAALVRTAVVRKLKAIPLLLLALCVMAMPFGINAVFFVSIGNQHSLMIFSFFFFYAFALMLWERCGELPPVRFAEKLPAAVKRAKKLPSAVCCGFLFVLILFNVVFANQVYLKKTLEYDATVSYLTKVTYSMEQTDGYAPGETPVLFIGDPRESSLFAPRTGFEDLNGTGLHQGFSTTYPGTYDCFFNEILSYRINWMNAADTRPYAELPEVQAMPVYPAGGSCQIVDGVLIVKFS